MLSDLDQLLLSLLLSKLVCQTRDRASNLREALLLVMLDAQVWEEITHVVRPDSLRRHVIDLLDFAAGTSQDFSLLRDLLLDKLVNLCLKVLLLVNHVVLKVTTTARGCILSHH